MSACVVLFHRGGAMPGLSPTGTRRGVLLRPCASSGPYSALGPMVGPKRKQGTASTVRNASALGGNISVRTQLNCDEHHYLDRSKPKRELKTVSNRDQGIVISLRPYDGLALSSGSPMQYSAQLALQDFYAICRRLERSKSARCLLPVFESRTHARATGWTNFDWGLGRRTFFHHTA